MAQDNNNLIWIDMEMSGLSPDTDRIIEVALVITDSQLNILAEAPVLVVSQPDSVLDGMDSWNKSTHGKSGLIDKVKASKMDEAEVEDRMIAFFAAAHSSSHLSHVRQLDLPGSPISGPLDASTGGLLSLPQSGCKHVEGTGEALEARDPPRFDQAVQA